MMPKISFGFVSHFFCLFMSMGQTAGALASPAAPLMASVTLGGKNYRIEVLSSLEDFSSQVRFENGAVATLPHSVIVGYSDVAVLKWISADSMSRHQNEAKNQIKLIDGIQAARIEVASAAEVLRLCGQFSRHPMVRYIHPDFIFSVGSRQASPGDEPLFPDQWNLDGTAVDGDGMPIDIGVRQAWERTQGEASTIVGLLDLGFEQSHEDLRDAWYVNLREIPGNKTDDDGNGLVDDVSGWNFSINGNNLIYGQNSKHGTASAGIIGARVNGRGISGICPRCKILPIVVSGRVSEDAAAILYALKMGASVLSNSWGYNMDPPTTDLVAEALSKAAKEGRGGKGLPIIFAMHNAAVDDCRPSYPDISGHASVIAVSSVDAKNRKVPESGYGSCLAFVAPSSGSSMGGIVTTDRSGKEGYNTDGAGNYQDLSYHNGFWGTSAAAPQVAGLFGLLLSAEPDMTLAMALNRMQQAAVKVQSASAQYDAVTGRSIKYGYGRIDARTMFQH
ncbi:MAG: S8 family serine peptidase [Proteobacteria bacterium]|nr:S8 family serine peptidase [Pseudomonadota bacterium]